MHTSKAASDLQAAGLTMSVDEAAKFLHVSRSTLYESLKNGTCPVKVIQVGGRRRIVTASLRRLLEVDDAEVA